MNDIEFEKLLEDNEFRKQKQGSDGSCFFKRITIEGYQITVRKIYEADGFKYRFMTS